MTAVFELIAVLIRSHGAGVGRHVKGLVFWGILCGLFAIVAGIYLVILLTHLLALWLGPAVALAVIAAAALVVAVVAFAMVRAEKRRLVAVHREHVEQERLAVRAAIAEVVAGGKLGGSVAAVSATVAAVIVVILRRLGGGEGGDPPGEEDAGT